jgi:MFS family permease
VVDNDSPGSGRFAALTIPDYRRLWWGGIFIFLASQTQQVARGWLAFELTGSNKGLGGVIFGFGVASLVTIPASGVIADRFPKRTIMVLAQSAMGLTALGIAIAVTTDTIAYWMLVAASVVQGSGMMLLGPSRLAMTADLVKGGSLTNAIFLSNASIQTTRVFGPTLAGILIAIKTVGVGGVYFVGAGLSLVSVISAVGLPPGNPQQRSGRSAFGDLADGITYVRRRPELARLLVIGIFVVMFGFPYITFLPGLIQDVYELDAWALGVLTASAAIGAVAASLFLAAVETRRLSALQFQAGLAFGASLVLFGGVPRFWGGVAVMVIVGGASSAFQAMNNSQALVVADVEYHGRVQSLLMLAFSGFGLMALPMGLLADRFGIREVMAAMGVLVGVVTLLGEVWRRRQPAPDLPDL